MSTYVCSDIHGQYDLYKSMLDEINFTAEDHLYILGDMIDRGQDGIRILQDVVSRPNVTCLLGNHEYMMWNYISRYIFKDLNWLNPSNGGMQTLSEYRRLIPADRAAVKKYLADLFLQIELTVEGTT
ncbi:MAG: metallophosphoesterase, partial [Firmicutes bacterium]|nr:metallophosphoesterase [Bacillota bacterium]